LKREGVGAGFKVSQMQPNLPALPVVVRTGIESRLRKDKEKSDDRGRPQAVLRRKRER